MTTTWGNANVPWSGSATVAWQLIRSQNFANRRARHQWPWIVYGSCATVDWTDIEPVKQNVNQNVTHTISYKWRFKSHHLTQTSASLMKNHRGHVTSDKQRFSCIQNTCSITSITLCPNSHRDQRISFNVHPKLRIILWDQWNWGWDEVNSTCIKTALKVVQ